MVSSLWRHIATRLDCDGTKFLFLDLIGIFAYLMLQAHPIVGIGYSKLSVISVVLVTPTLTFC